MVEPFLNNSKLLKKMNKYTLPEMSHPDIVSYWRPVSLYNVLYKIIFKNLANGLRVVLPKILSQLQLLSSKIEIFRMKF